MSVRRENVFCTSTIKLLFPALKIMLGDNRQPSSVKQCRQDCHIAALAEYSALRLRKPLHRCSQALTQPGTRKSVKHQRYHHKSPGCATSDTTAGDSPSTRNLQAKPKCLHRHLCVSYNSLKQSPKTPEVGYPPWEVPEAVGGNCAFVRRWYRHSGAAESPGTVFALSKNHMNSSSSTSNFSYKRVRTSGCHYHRYFLYSCILNF